MGNTTLLLADFFVGSCDKPTPLPSLTTHMLGMYFLYPWLNHLVPFVET